VLGHRGLGEAEVVGQVDDAVLAEGEVPQDRQPRRFAEAVEEQSSRAERAGLVHLVSIVQGR
jgi:hypothetical protein